MNTIGDYVAIARRRRRLLLAFCPGVMLIAILLAFKLPALYRSSGTIMLEASSVPAELVRSTVASYADQQIELLRRRVLTVDRLSELVNEIDPYPQLQLSTREKAELIQDNTEIERVDPVTLEPLLESTAFSIHYHNPSPQLAAEVASAIVALFLEHNTESRTETATETYSFLVEQATKLEDDIGAAERAIAVFRQKHAGALPDSQNLNQTQVERAERDLVEYDRRIREQEQQQGMLRLQLAQTPPSLMVAAGNWRLELAELQAQLTEAQQRYTEEHPDVRRLKRSIDTLIAESTASGGRQGRSPDNPAYLQIQQQLRSLDTELGALRKERTDVRSQLDEYARRLDVAPEIEREYLTLTRDYEIVQNEYREIKQKIAEAEMARSLEVEQRGERFAQIRSPYAPSTPHSPNRLGIILLGFVLALGGGIGIAAIAEASDSTIRGARDLRDILETPPIGAVPYIYNAGDRRRRNMRWAVAAGLFVSVALIGGML
jgi:polysaccharide chain length determinant protein (PEP-CTERM system associated)